MKTISRIFYVRESKKVLFVESVENLLDAGCRIGNTPLADRGGSRDDVAQFLLYEMTSKMHCS